MARVIWKGHISFGLVEIPVGLYPGVKPDEISFSLLDKRDVSPVGYRKVSKRTGEEVPKDEIVRGYEIEEDRYVLLDEEDFRQASVAATRTIDILHFTDGASIDPRLYDKPYLVAPERRGSKAFALFRASLARSGKVGIATIVLRSRQYLAAVLVRGDAVVVELLRYPHELRDARELDLPSGDLRELGVRDSEIRMADRLINELTEPFEPSQYRDEYREDLLALIRRKAEEGRAAEIRPPVAEAAGEAIEPVDLLALLRRSIDQSAKKNGGDGLKRTTTRDSKQARRDSETGNGASRRQKTKSKKSGPSRKQSDDADTRRGKER